jgi:hypothetical protein
LRFFLPEPLPALAPFFFCFFFVVFLSRLSLAAALALLPAPASTLS